MNDTDAKNKTLTKRAIILIILIGVIMTLSVIFIIISGRYSSDRKTATIYVDGSVYMTIDLLSSDDTIIEVTNSKGNINHIQIKDHNIRMLDSDCKNGLCVSQGWADNSLVPIVCLPNNVVIITGSKITENGGNEYDAISY